MTLGNELDFQVVAETSSGLEALELAEKNLPDVVLMDIRLSHMDGLETMSTLLGRSYGLHGRRMPKVIVFTSLDRDEYLLRSIKLGASGFLLKSCSRTMLLMAIRAVAMGEAVICPQMTRRLIDHFEISLRSTGAGKPEVFGELSRRELDVLRGIAQGKSNKEIARDLRLTSATIKCHVSSLLAKLGLRDRVQAALLAHHTKLVHYSAADLGISTGRKAESWWGAHGGAAHSTYESVLTPAHAAAG